MTLIYPPEGAPTANDVVWDDIAETAWERVEITDCECVYQPRGKGYVAGRLIVEYLTAEAAAIDDCENKRRATFTDNDGNDWVWEFVIP